MKIVVIIVVILYCYLLLFKKSAKTNTINLCYWKYLILPYLRSWVPRDKRERSSRGLKLHLTTHDAIQKFFCHRNVIYSRHNLDEKMLNLSLTSSFLITASLDVLFPRHGTLFLQITITWRPYRRGSIAEAGESGSFNAQMYPEGVTWSKRLGNPCIKCLI